jgi:hypothetical protein
MFIITDENNIVVDMATRQESLSRGYAYPNHIIVELTEVDMTIGDTYKDGLLTRNVANRLQIKQQGIDETKITQKIRDITRADAIAALKATGDLPADF